MEKLILIDGNAIIHRAFHALPPFKTSKGLLVNAIYGFASMLLNILNHEKPNYIAVSFDLKGPTFRHAEYKEYKATRVKAPDELYEQIPYIKNLVRAFNIPIYEIEGFEADDVLGTLAKQAEKNPGLISYIVTGDMDTLQLVTEKTKILAPFKGFNEVIIYDTAKVLGKYGLKPSQIPDMKGLCGDNSDNIKGVAGIGPKTAKTLLQKYGTIENIYENLTDISKSVAAKLEKDKENAFFSKHLATIITETPVTLNLENCQAHHYDKEKLVELFEELEFKSLLRKLNEFNNHCDEKNKEENGKQASLF